VAKECKAAGAKDVTICVADVSVEEDCKRIGLTAKEAFKTGINFLVINAGIGMRARVDEVKDTAIYKRYATLIRKPALARHNLVGFNVDWLMSTLLELCTSPITVSSQSRLRLVTSLLYQARADSLVYRGSLDTACRKLP
jgi:NAD(P)-dependent dehydrogenase (short-subunit alcohol dehydrogenase family)